MKLSLSEKQTFYHELGRFAQSGITMPRAVESLSADNRGALRAAFDELSRLFLGGESVTTAFAQLRPAVGSMEAALIEASDRSGRLDQAFQYLSNYFGTLDKVRAGIIKECLWPVVQLHLAAFVLSFVGEYVAGTIGGGGGFNVVHFVLQVAGSLGVFYAMAAVGLGGGFLFVRLARTSLTLDALLSALPLIGRLRRNLALSRFCATYEMQISAGVNAMDSLQAAGDASQSARVRAEVQRMVPAMMAGESVGTLIVGRTAFPVAFQRSVRTAEETGTLDADLRRWSDYYQKASVDAMEAAGAWLSRIVTITIFIFVGYKIVTAYAFVQNAAYKDLLE